MTHVLFICSMNQWRSPTAEAIFRRGTGINVRSAGTSSRAKRTVSVKDLRWADVVLVMEQKHKTRLQAQFRDEVRYKTLYVLDIPDDYRYMDQELIDLLRAKVEPLL
ncbi:MAG: protein tyrosine phosphatase [Pseudomonadota bacterium]